MTEEEQKLMKAVHGELHADLVRVYPMRTICEVLREIYWGTKDVAIREKVKEAMVMAKAMDQRLTWYYEQAHPDSEKRYDEGLWKENPYMDVKREEQALEELRESHRIDVRKGRS